MESKFSGESALTEPAVEAEAGGRRRTGPVLLRDFFSGESALTEPEVEAEGEGRHRMGPVLFSCGILEGDAALTELEVEAVVGCRRLPVKVFFRTSIFSFYIALRAAAAADRLA